LRLTAVYFCADQRDDHVEAITRFARTCLLRTNQLTSALDATLGPGTSELALRFGIHSGPVTAGVLRGEKARFQLFGDTMNFAARMESTGIRNKIHLSKATADILIKRGKGHWVAQREGTVYAKGKGELSTYWLQIGQSGSSAAASQSSGASSTGSGEFVGVSVRTDAKPGDVLMGVIGETKLNKQLDRLVEWNCGALSDLLKKVVASRGDKGGALLEQTQAYHDQRGASRSFMGEMDLIIPLPSFDAEAVARVHETKVSIPRLVRSQLRMYVAAIASGYRKNAFHNFEHASHVILSATKLLKRISYADGHANEDGVTTADLHHYTYGISSDPLTQFAVVFAALIHDVGMFFPRKNVYGVVMAMPAYSLCLV
jgi:Adenylate and Guanylate cyclase catalytic domain